MPDLIGLDVHGDRGPQNWEAWSKVIDYVAFKVVEGATFLDYYANPFRARERIKEIEDAGIIFLGPYPFLYPENGSDWKTEADFYLSVCDKIGIDWDKTWPLPDLEHKGPAPEGIWTHNWCDHVEKHTGRNEFATPGLVYTGRFFWADNAGAEYPPPHKWGLWRPHYGRSSWPSAAEIEPWNVEKTPVIWQDSSTWDGYRGGDWDRNRFRGTREDLIKEMTKKRNKPGKHKKTGESPQG